MNSSPCLVSESRLFVPSLEEKNSTGVEVFRKQVEGERSDPSPIREHLRRLQLTDTNSTDNSPGRVVVSRLTPAKTDTTQIQRTKPNKIQDKKKIRNSNADDEDGHTNGHTNGHRFHRNGSHLLRESRIGGGVGGGVINGFGLGVGTDLTCARRDLLTRDSDPSLLSIALPPSVLSTWRVLIVEDDTASLRLMTRLIKNIGFQEVFGADSLAQATATIEQLATLQLQPGTPEKLTIKTNNSNSSTEISHTPASSYPTDGRWKSESGLEFASPAPSPSSSSSSFPQFPVQLLISDINLLDGTGLDVLKFLIGKSGSSVSKSSLNSIPSAAPFPDDLAFPLFPAIACTGNGSSEDINNSKLSGFSLHLVKPIDSKQLKMAVHKVIQPFLNNEVTHKNTNTIEPNSKSNSPTTNSISVPILKTITNPVTVDCATHDTPLALASASPNQSNGHHGE